MISNRDFYTMNSKIETDRRRFSQIVRGTIKSGLRKYMSHTRLIGGRGDNTVSVPIPQVELPHFKHETFDGGGLGQGDGKAGESVPGRGARAGNAPGEHEIEVDVPIEDLAEILGEGLELPRIRPRGTRTISVESPKLAGIRRVGPQALCDFKRTFKAALSRQMMTGEYDFENPVVTPVPDDRRFRSWKVQDAPHAAAAVIYMMDVSGSMADEQKKLVRMIAFWIDTWLTSQYDSIERRFIIHDAEARIVDEHSFYHSRENGGTLISSALEACDRLIESRYPPSQWNVYPFHFSDGDNWEDDDTSRCLHLLTSSLLPKVNQFSYCQVESRYGSGDFIDSLRDHFDDDDRLAASDIAEEAQVCDVIKDFLGKGR